VFAVFDRIGYVLGDAESNWDVLWAHEYPFETLSKVLSDLRPHQRVRLTLFSLHVKIRLFIYLQK